MVDRAVASYYGWSVNLNLNERKGLKWYPNGLTSYRFGPMVHRKSSLAGLLAAFRQVTNPMERRTIDSVSLRLVVVAVANCLTDCSSPTARRMFPPLGLPFAVRYPTGPHNRHFKSRFIYLINH